MTRTAPLDRRTFLQSMAAAGLTGSLTACSTVLPARRERLRHASMGAAGMAGLDIDMLASHDRVDLVAVAEIDLGRVEELRQKYPKARIYQDWRELLEQEQDNIDSVNVSTPDHMHAVITMEALRRGKHVYCQKPLAHDIHDVRRMTEYARERGLVTQMGIQIHSQRVYREAVALVRGGAIGKVRAAHLWSKKKWGAQGPPPAGEFAIPEDLDWDGWLGVCADRPFIGDNYYHPGQWRRRLDFGTGTFGDMGCHIFDPMFEALGLDAPISVRSEGEAPDAWNWANNARIRYRFPPTRYTIDSDIEVCWYDGDDHPPAEVMALVTEKDPPPLERPPPPIPNQGSVIIGTTGTMLLPHFKPATLFPRANYREFARPKIKSRHHWHQWIDACLGRGKVSTGFDYAGPLTETVLLGCVAVRFPHQTLEWNAANLEFTNEPRANQFLRRDHRPGWEVKA